LCAKVDQSVVLVLVPNVENSTVLAKNSSVTLRKIFTLGAVLLTFDGH